MMLLWKELNRMGKKIQIKWLKLCWLRGMFRLVGFLLELNKLKKMIINIVNKEMLLMYDVFFELN